MSRIGKLKKFSKRPVLGASLAALSVMAIGVPMGAGSLAKADLPTTKNGIPNMDVSAKSGWHTDVIAQNQTLTVNGTVIKLTKPDDITRMGNDIFVAYQNGVGPQGQSSSNGINFSTIVEYGIEGGFVASWNLTGHTDGLTADPLTHKLIATVNEDANSSLYTIDPSSTGNAVTQYNYDLGNPLPHGGGTDAVSIYKGMILISASAPGTTPTSNTATTSPAVYVATLSGPASGQQSGTANLKPYFYDGSTATVANETSPTYTSLSPSPSAYGTVPPEGTKVTLALTDPDSNEVVPRAAPRFGGNFVLDSQGDQQLIFADGTVANNLSVLNLSQSINDSAFVTNASGKLFVSDPKNNEILALSGPMLPGQVIVAATPSSANNPVNIPNYLATLNLTNGTVTPITGVENVVPQGLLFVSQGSGQSVADGSRNPSLR